MNNKFDKICSRPCNLVKMSFHSENNPYRPWSGYISGYTRSDTSFRLKLEKDAENSLRVIVR